MSVNYSKFIHTFLIVVLCYGQLVANVHIAGHFHAHSEDGQSAALIDFGAYPHGQDHSTLSADQHNHSLHSDSAAETDRDCGIYHALSSLNGGFWALQNRFTLPQQLAAGLPNLPSFLPLAGLGSLQIRAPPVIS